MTTMQPNSIKVYSKPICVQCTATYRALDNAGLAYDKVDISEDTEAYNLVARLGYKAVPVVYLNETQHWSGFRPDLINKMKESNDVRSDDVSPDVQAGG